jgi:hypothetical protein
MYCHSDGCIGVRYLARHNQVTRDPYHWPVQYPHIELDGVVREFQRYRAECEKAHMALFAFADDVPLLTIEIVAR